MDRLITYVDGFNLYHGLREKSGHRLLWLDLVALARKLRPRSQLVTVRYFTAPVLDDPGGASRQGAYQSALLAHTPGLLSIVQGRYQRKTVTCKRCNRSWTSYEEKETDVNIATSLVADAANGAATSALIISADSDLVPGVNAAKQVAPGNFFAAAFPPRRYSAELMNLMPASLHIGMSKLNASLLPETVIDQASGRQYRRPEKWY